MTVSPVRSLLLRALLWLPLSFLVWAYLNPVLLLPVLYLTRMVAALTMPEAVSNVEISGETFDVVTAYTLAQTGLASDQPPSMQLGQLVFQLNPLIYAYGTPLLVALIFSVPEPLEDKWGRIALGVLALFLVQTWGVVFGILKVLAFNAGPQVAELAGILGWRREAVALGYQFGYLILPAVTPLILWMYFYRDFLGTLVPAFAREPVPPQAPDTASHTTGDDKP